MVSFMPGQMLPAQRLKVEGVWGLKEVQRGTNNGHGLDGVIHAGADVACIQVSGIG
jgi:hypothetical protein